MTENVVALITLPDYSGKNLSKFFVWDGQELMQTKLKNLSKYMNPIVTTNFQFVASEMVKSRFALPQVVFDLEELVIAASKKPKVSEIRKNFDNAALLSRYGLSEQNTKMFRKMNSSSGVICDDLLEQVGRSLIKSFTILKRLAQFRDEWNRFVEVEVPSMLMLYEHILRGVRFRKESLAEFRETIEFDYYKALKDFSAKHDFPLEVPSQSELFDFLTSSGFDLHNTSIEFLLKFIALENNFGEDVLRLRKLKITRDALNGISHKKNKSFPQVYSQGTRTSRILLRAPSIQNIAKKYRKMLIPSAGKTLSYIDYDQFEVGIMGALSSDPVLLELYAQDDLYENFACSLFGDKGKRKHSKRLFLSYAYGMRKQNLIDAACELGSSTTRAKNAFGQFKTFEKWKLSLTTELALNRKLGTDLGNFYHLQHSNKPTAKDVRSAVSQKVQGTGALIFKKALLDLPKDRSFRVILPMHDAVLVEHKEGSDPQVVVDIFENAMTEFFEGKIKGKASVSDFAE